MKITLLLPWHPTRFRDEGDPYYRQCMKTAELVATELALPEEQWLVTFQSRFGREEWLQPYTDKTLEQLARDGTKRVDVICPGFSADCPGNPGRDRREIANCSSKQGAKCSVISRL